MHTLSLTMLAMGGVCLVVLRVISEITAYLLLAHYDWKLRRNTKAIVTNSETP